jgi:colanic acid biosynthesis glycosyl transferase WcaI
MSRIVIWSPNYWPEPIGIPPLVTQAAEWFAGRGHEVDVVTAVPNYPERVVAPAYRGCWRGREERNGVRVHRHWLRVRPEERFIDKALYEMSFALSSLPTYVGCARRADAVVCVVPSVLAAAVAASLPRNARLVLWVQDVISAAARSLERKPGRALTAIARLERAAVRRADHVVVCSPGFAPLLGAPRGQTSAIPNWVDTDEIVARAPELNGRPTRFLYAGNLGYTQGFETLLAAARTVDGVEVRLVGAGNAAGDVRRAARAVASVSPPVARAELVDLLASADVQLVVQRRVSAGANLPSKIATYLASGRPILAAIDADTAAASLLRESGGAVLVPPEDPAALANAMAGLRDDPVLRAELGRRGRRFAETRLARDVVLPRLEAAILG